MSTEHLGGCFIDGDLVAGIGDPGTYAPQVWAALIERYKPKNVIDVGCGGGYSLKYFMDHHVDGIGVEGFLPAIERSPVKGNIVVHDYTLGPYVPPSEFDLGWCCEFVEHVEEKYVPNFMATFTACKIVAMTHAVPGQPGFHHVNCQPAKYWIDVFAGHGYKLEKKLSENFRSLLEGATNGGHVKNTLMIFKRKVSK